ncbi:MAG: hypothetical protein AB1439_06365 [candidate division FCPU426 bacterium]
MHKIHWQALLSAALLALSGLMYLAQYQLFHDLRNTGFYLLQDMAFVPLQVLIVTLIIDRLLSIREKQAMLEKMNMAIGTFFSDVGTALLARCAAFSPGSVEAVRQTVLFKTTWTRRDFRQAVRTLATLALPVDSRAGDLDALRNFLIGKRPSLLNLLQNPNLLEHERFTSLLWATFHLTEELAARETLRNAPAADLNHLASDLQRVYALLLKEWLAYLGHLQERYPYLFSFALRTNPFNPEARVQIE